MKKTIVLRYFFDEDVLFIPIGEEKSPVGDEEFQEDVVLYRDNNNKVVGIEILNFSKFHDSKICIEEGKSIDFHPLFDKLKQFISLRDIMYDDEEQFESTLRIWGWTVKKVDEHLPKPKDFSIETEMPIMPECV